jgi:dTDP-4-amino-4,6-dideoxy-D-glucose/dTDP-4-amino-2,4-dideoxy-beta-L-xylose transaminase
MIPLFKVFMSEDAPKIVSEVLMSGWIGQGKKVDDFEQKLRNFLKSEYLLTVNSGTSAEHLAIHILMSEMGIAPGDTVVSTPLTCTATNWPLLANGLRILWSDIDPTTLNVDLDDFENKLCSPGKNGLPPKIGVVVHWGGYPVDELRLQDVKENYFDKWGAYPVIVEDCAHAFGTLFLGAPLPTYGNVCFYSFQAIKHLTCGDGGALIVPNEKMLKRGKLLRWYGINRDDRDRRDFRCEAPIVEWGYKFHMNDINAAIGLANFPHMEWIIARQRLHAAYYDQMLEGTPGVTLLTRDDRVESSYWLYTMRVERKMDFIRMMTEKQIQVSKVHERNDIHPCVSEFRSCLPNLDSINDEIVSIPVGWWVHDEQRNYIVESIQAGW